MAEENL